MGDFNRESFYQFFIRHCAPTMASLKCSNMMSCPDEPEYRKALEQIRQELEEKGIRVRIISLSKNRMLILVYRPNMLAKRLAEAENQDFLGDYGYGNLLEHGGCQGDVCEERHQHGVCPSAHQGCVVESSLDLLQRHIAADPTNFPHEIGVFLGYPLADIKGFIQNNGKNGLHCGEWKVYHEPEAAVKMFAKFKKCREVYYDLFSRGRRTMYQLTVAA